MGGKLRQGLNIYLGKIEKKRNGLINRYVSKTKVGFKRGKGLCCTDACGIHYIMFWFANAMLITGGKQTTVTMISYFLYL